MFPREMLEKIKGVWEILSETKKLAKKVKGLETERANLMAEIERLKKMAESKVSTLESEVSMLHEEVESLRALLGYEEEPKEQ